MTICIQQELQSHAINKLKQNRVSETSKNETKMHQKVGYQTRIGYSV